MKTDTKLKTKANSRAGGLWVSYSLLTNADLTGDEKCMLALIDQLTISRNPCDWYTRDLAKMLRLTPDRAELMLASLKDRRYVIELHGWFGKGWVARVLHPSISAKPVTVRNHIKVHGQTQGSWETPMPESYHIECGPPKLPTFLHAPVKAPALPDLLHPAPQPLPPQPLLFPS